MKQPSGDHRWDYIDSVRGIAALMVVAYHWIGHVTVSPVPLWGEGASLALQSIFNGPAAVSVFFVISGIVLSLRYFQHPDKPIHYREFIIKRLFRLYPAYWVALVGMFLYMHRDFTFHVFEEILKFLTEASLVRDYSPLYGAGWTLNVEMAVSLLMPVFILVVRHDRQWFFVLTVLSVLLSKFYLVYVFHFLLGMWIALYFDQIRMGAFRSHWAWRWRYALLLPAFMAFSGRFLGLWIGYGKGWDLFVTVSAFHWDQLAAVPSALLLVWVIGSARWQRLLSADPLVFLGKISYGVYLMHWWAVLQLLGPNIDFFRQGLGVGDAAAWAVEGLCALALTILTATALHYWVEIPMIRKGRERGKRWGEQRT
jgi:peptidoglycan/LPS O-acetylase OafA/YrhL